MQTQDFTEQPAAQFPNLHECPGCGFGVSKRAVNCPRCGEPINSGPSLGQVLSVTAKVFLSLLILSPLVAIVVVIIRFSLSN